MRSDARYPYAVPDSQAVPDLTKQPMTHAKQNTLVAIVMAALSALGGVIGSHWGGVTHDEMNKSVGDAKTEIFKKIDDLKMASAKDIDDVRNTAYTAGVAAGALATQAKPVAKRHRRAEMTGRDE